MVIGNMCIYMQEKDFIRKEIVKNNNFLYVLIECKGFIGEYWFDIMVVQIEYRQVYKKRIKG